MFYDQILSLYLKKKKKNPDTRDMATYYFGIKIIFLVLRTGAITLQIGLDFNHKQPQKSTGLVMKL